MPFIAHRDDIETGTVQRDGWRSLALVRGELSSELDADIRLNVLSPGASTSRHYHTGCEHYLFIIAGEAELLVEDETHPVQDGYFISIDPGERHALTNVGREKFEYLEFLVPGSSATTEFEEQSNA